MARRKLESAPRWDFEPQRQEDREEHSVKMLHRVKEDRRFKDFRWITLIAFCRAGGILYLYPLLFQHNFSLLHMLFSSTIYGLLELPNGFRVRASYGYRTAVLRPFYGLGTDLP